MLLVIILLTEYNSNMITKEVMDLNLKFPVTKLLIGSWRWNSTSHGHSKRAVDRTLKLMIYQIERDHIKEEIEFRATKARVLLYLRRSLSFIVNAALFVGSIYCILVIQDRADLIKTEVLKWSDEKLGVP